MVAPRHVPNLPCAADLSRPAHTHCFQGGGEVGSEAPFGGGPIPLGMCPVCPALNPAMAIVLATSIHIGDVIYIGNAYARR